MGQVTGLTQVMGESVEHARKEGEIGSMETKLRDQKTVEESGDEVQSRAEAEQEQVWGLSGGILEIRLTGFEDWVGIGGENEVRLNKFFNLS